jgi:hypothetical protein
MPEPTHFLSKKFPPVAIIRPTSTQNAGAMAAVKGFVDDGLFIGQQNPEFLKLLYQLAGEADEARRRT